MVMVGAGAGAGATVAETGEDEGAATEAQKGLLSPHHPPQKPRRGFYERARYLYKVGQTVADGESERRRGFIQGKSASLLAGQLFMAAWARGDACALNRILKLVFVVLGRLSSVLM